MAKLFFAYGLGNSLTFPFSVGASTVLNPGRPTPAGVAELLATQQPTLFFAAPGFVAALLDADIPAETFASVRCSVTAGEALPAELQRRFSERTGQPVLDGIGSTEALHIFLSNHVDDTEPGTSGSPVDGLRGQAPRRVRPAGRGRRPARLPPRARPVHRLRLLAPDRGDAGRVPG